MINFKNTSLTAVFSFRSFFSAIILVFAASALLGLQAQAATTILGPIDTTVSTGAEYTSLAVDASTKSNLLLSFDYDIVDLDAGDTLVYGWRSGATDVELGSISGVNADTSAVENITVPLPAAAQVSDLTVYLRVESSAGSDDAAITALSVTGVNPIPVTPYSNGFESDTTDWNDFGGTITQVQTATDGIFSQCGDGHAVIDGSVFSRWGGYANTFPDNGYTTEIDVFIDTTLSDGSPDKGFDFSSAINNTNENPTHRRDFIFHLETDEGQPGVWLVSASNNAPGNPSADSDAAEITESGWYTLQAYFYDDGTGVLAVDMNVIDRSDDSIVFSETRSDPSDVIGATVGGNRYAWFTSQRFDLDSVAIDNAQLYLGAPQARTCADDNKTTSEIDVSGNTATFYDEPGTWIFNRDTNTASEFEFNTDQATLGNGALYVLPIDGNLNGKNDKFIGELFLHELVSNIDQISYNYRLGSGATSADANEFYANAYINFDGSDDYGHCVYNIVPTNGAPGWHTMVFNPFLDYDVRQRSSAPQTCPDSPADMGPDAELRMFAINLGDTGETSPGSNIGTDQGVDGYFDEVVVETDTEIITYDLEPDTTKPTIVVDSPDDGFIIGGGTFDITVTATDDTEINQVVINLRDDTNTTIGSCLNISSIGLPSTTTSCSVDADSLGNGDYRFVTNARDAAGNLSNTITQDFTVDDSKPVIEVDSPEDNLETSEDFDISVSATDTVGIQRLVINLKNSDGSHLASCLNEQVNGVLAATSSCTVDVSELSPGSYQFRTNAHDVDGNVSNTISRTFTILEPEPFQRLGIVGQCRTSDGGMRFSIRNYNSQSFELTYSVSGTGEIGTTSVLGLDEGEVIGDTPELFRVLTILETETGTEAGRVTFTYTKPNGDMDTIIRREKSGDACDPASLEITQPLIDGAVLTPGVFEFAATYTDDDTTEDVINWAIKPGSCEANAPEVNLLGFGTPGYVPATYNSATGAITISADMTNFADGDYCLVVNPAETGGETDTDREIRLFSIETPVLSCSLQSDTGTLVNESNQFAVLVPENDIPGAWTADIDGEWIWVTTEINDTETDTTFTFSETFNVTGIESANLSVAADNYYKVFVNGNLVIDESTGSSNNFQDHTAQYNEDITSFLNEGENEISFEVMNLGVEGSDARSNPAGLLYKLDIEYENECSVTTAPEQLEVIDPDDDDDGLGDGNQESPLAAASTGGGGYGGSNDDDDDEELLSPDLQEAVLGAATSRCALINDHMRIGQPNDEWEVTKLQLFLYGQGYNVSINGEFDAETDAAVRAFQLDHKAEVLTPWLTAGLATDDDPSGWVYLLTKWKINDIVCGTNTPMPKLE